MSIKLKTDKNKIAYIINKSNQNIINSVSIDDNDETGYSCLKLDSNSKFQLIPNVDKERTTLFVAGESGAGKSYFCCEYVKQYNKLYPSNKIYLISYLDQDETLDSFKKIIRLDISNAEFLDSIMDINLDEFSKSFIIFDDIDSIHNKNAKKVLYGFLNKLLRLGRHYYISVAYLGHELYSSHDLKLILNECLYITWFPKYLNYKKIKYLCEEYFGLNKKDLEKIKNIKSSRSITYIKGYPKLILTDNEVFTLN